MAWQLIFKAPDDTDELPPLPMSPRKPVSLTVQIDLGSTTVLAGDDEDDDD